MKRRRIRYYFNMVEIALALAVLAIGISSILVLFPVGINANRSAIADNNLADISEYLMGYLRAGCAAEWAKIAADKNNAPNVGDYFFTDKIATSYGAIDTVGDSSGIDPESTDYTDIDSNTRWISPNLYQVSTSGSYPNSVFLYKQTTGVIVDFAAVVKVWRENPDFLIRKADNSIDKIPSPGNLRPYATVLCIEISWPAQAPYAQREKRLFRQEIFNEAYRYNY